MNARTWKKLGACLCAGALVAALCAGCASKVSDDAAQPLVNGVTDRQEVVYCLYFGLTDKDTGKQELTMEEAKDIAIPLFIEAGSGYTVYEAEGASPKRTGPSCRTTRSCSTAPTATSRPSSTLSRRSGGRSTSKACTASPSSSAARYAAASYRASRKRRIERCERRLLLRAAFAQKPSFVRCLKTALYDECC